MPANAKISFEIKGSTACLEFNRHINENCEFEDLDFQNKPEIELDFKKVELINSIGVKKTFELFNKIPKDARLKLLNCPVVIINQLNIFPGLIENKNAEIIRFAIPYYCETCDMSTDIFVNELIEQKAPQKNCETCNNQLELDEFEDVYFNFLASA